MHPAVSTEHDPVRLCSTASIQWPESIPATGAALSGRDLFLRGRAARKQMARIGNSFHGQPTSRTGQPKKDAGEDARRVAPQGKTASRIGPPRKKDKSDDQAIPVSLSLACQSLSCSSRS